MNNVLVVGGAGYIGRHTVLYLQEHGIKVTVVDNYSNSYADFTIPGVSYVETDISQVDTKYLNKFSGVIYLAADKSVLNSEQHPSKYLDNLTTLRDFLERLDESIPLMYASSAAAINPVNTYGLVKAISEKIINELHPKHTILRYQNVAGADPKGRTGPDPRIIDSFIDKTFLQKNLKLRKGIIFPRRDYVHVWDVAMCNVFALVKAETAKGNKIFNVASGKTTSVKQIANLVGRKCNVEPISKSEVLISKGKPDKYFYVTMNMKDIIKDVSNWYRNLGVPTYEKTK